MGGTSHICFSCYQFYKTGVIESNKKTVSVEQCSQMAATKQCPFITKRSVGT